MIEDLKKKNIFYKNYEIINFINTNDIEKRLILEWRNSDSVRKWMTNKDIISIEEHLNYVESLKNNKQKLCFLVKENSDYLGIIEFDNINYTNKSAYFGLNANPNNKKLGIGRILEEVLLYIAKEKLLINKLKLYVFIENKLAINLYKKFGFLITKEDSIHERKIYYMEKIL